MLEKGQLIGNYRVLEEIGRGGMGIVYKAQHSMIKEKIMAIKVIHDFIISMPKVVERFKQEANVMYSLRNPNIVYVEDLDEQDGIYFIVMEYVEGESLRQRLQREKIILVNEAINTAEKICQGLEVAHSRKPPIIHRDLKPENILITKDNEIKITDFGLAKIVGDSNISMMSKLSIGKIPTEGISERKELSIGDIPTDVKDEILQISPGTFAYMSPEQRRAEELDTRTDIYSLGLILYEMLIGELPAGLRPSLPSQVLKEAAKGLDVVLFKCLEEDKSERYSSTNELIAELTTQQKRAVEEAEVKEELPRIIEVEYKPISIIHPWAMFRHDPQHTGRSPYNGPMNPRIKWDVDIGDNISSSPAVGPDGTICVGSHDHKLYAINPDGSKEWGSATGGDISSSPAIGADGTIYVGSYDKKLYAINYNGSKKWEFATGDMVVSSPAISADGIIYVGSNDNKLYAINPDGSKKWEFATGGYVHSSPAVGADGTIYVGSNDNKLYAINPDGTMKWEFATEGVIFSSPAVGADGSIYVGSHDHKLYAINPDGSRRWAFGTEWNIESSPAIGADGTIYVGSGFKLYAINYNGSKKWEFAAGSEIRTSNAIMFSFAPFLVAAVNSSPAIGANGIIYVGSNDKKLYAFYPHGSKKWDFVTGDAVVSSPAIGADGTIYVGSGKRIVNVIQLQE